MTRAVLRRTLLALALLGARAASAAPTGVLSSDSGHYRQALEGFSEAWGSTVAVVAAGAPLPADARVFVAFGGRAAAREWPSDAVVVACLAPSATTGPNDRVTHVSLLADPSVLITRLRGLFPKLKVLRVIWSSETSRDDTDALVKAAAERGVAVLSERVSPPSRLPASLRELRGEADALWLMPDPALVTAENFAILREYAAARRLPFVAPTEGLAERGATAVIAVTFRDMGRAAAASLRARLDGRGEAETVRSDRVVVTVNGSAARAIGLVGRFESADKVLP